MKSYVTDDYQGAKIINANLENATIDNSTINAPTITNPVIEGATMTGGSLEQERVDRIAADNVEATARDNADTTERNARIAADNTLQTNITAEATARANADSILTTRIATEETNRASAVAAEANARAAADAQLQPLDSDLTAIAALTPANDDFVQRKAGAWTNRTIAQVKADLNLVADTSTALTTETTARTTADNTLQANIDTAVANADSRVSRAGDVMTGMLRVPILTISDIIVDKAWSFSFAAAGINQKLDLYCTTTTGLESLMDIMISTNTGALARRFSMQKQGTGIIQSGSRYNEVIGQVAPYLAISDVEWDVENLRWRFKIVNRAPLGIPLTGTVSIHLVGNTNNAYALAESFGIGPVYTTDATSYPEPIFQFAGAIQADALITNFIKKGVNYTLNPIDSILIATAGITVTLPSVQIVGVGRSYTIKNIQNSGVTVVPTGTSKIDTGTSYTVGNKRTITVTSDGTDWWITSAF